MGLIKNYRNQGIGTKLIKKAIAYAKKMALKKLNLKYLKVTL